MEFFELLILWPLHGILEAVAGAHWPGQDPTVRRLRRVALGLLAVGAIFLVSSVASFFWHERLINLSMFVLFVLAHLSFISAGAVGNRIERQCKRKP
jgi:hypothetical protein